LFGELSGGHRTHWSETDYGIIVLQAARVTDASPYLGKSDSRGWVWTNGTGVRFAEYDAQLGLYLTMSESIAGGRFPDSIGSPTTVAVEGDLETVIVVMDGNPAEVWWHDRADVNTEALKVGAAENGAKQIRTSNGIFAISNNGSNSVTVGVWSPIVAVKGHHPVGEKPVGVDVMGLDGGGAAVVSTSWFDNTYTVLIVDASGGVTSSETKNMPGGCFAEYAIFVPGLITYIAFSCVANQEVSLIETSLQAKL
jgi:hypothetical protein